MQCAMMYATQDLAYVSVLSSTLSYMKPKPPARLGGVRPKNLPPRGHVPSNVASGYPAGRGVVRPGEVSGRKEVGVVTRSPFYRREGADLRWRRGIGMLDRSTRHVWGGRQLGVMSAGSVFRNSEKTSIWQGPSSCLAVTSCGILTGGIDAESLVWREVGKRVASLRWALAMLPGWTPHFPRDGSPCLPVVVGRLPRVHGHRGVPASGGIYRQGM